MAVRQRKILPPKRSESKVRIVASSDRPATMTAPTPFVEIEASPFAEENVEWFESADAYTRALTADYMARGRGRLVLVGVLLTAGLAMGAGLFLSLFIA